MVMVPKPALQPLSVVIAAGESLSAAVDLSVKNLMTVIMPNAWTMAPLTFQISLDGTTFYNLCYSTTGEVELPVMAGMAVTVPSDLNAAWNFLKFRSGSSARPVPQPVDRQFMLGVSE